MGKLFKIDLGEEDELFLGYHQRKLYQHFRKCCKNKLKQLTKYQKKLHRKYLKNNNNFNNNNNNNNDDDKEKQTILTDELDAELNYYYELNKYATNLLNYDGTTDSNSNNANNTNNNNNDNNENKEETKEKQDDKTKNDNINDNNNNDNDNILESEIIEMMVDEQSFFNYHDYKSVLYDIAYNDNTRNYKIFKKIFQDKERNKKQREDENGKSLCLAVDGLEIYCCIRCGMHLTKKSLVMDENFHGRTGPSFLIQSVFNIDIGPKATRKLHTGMHVVSDVFCKRCSTNVGWYYHEAQKQEQQYKISHYVLECALICTLNQYMMHNYYQPSNLLPSLNLNNNNNNNQSMKTHTINTRKTNNKNKRKKPKKNDDSDDDDDDDDDDDEEDDGSESDDDGSDESEDDTDDDRMNDLSKYNNNNGQESDDDTQHEPLPPYMSYDHPSFSGFHPRNGRMKNRGSRKRRHDNKRRDRNKKRQHGGKHGKNKKGKNIGYIRNEQKRQNDDDGEEEEEEEERRYNKKRIDRMKTKRKHRSGKGTTAGISILHPHEIRRGRGNQVGGHMMAMMTSPTPSTQRRGSIKSDYSNDNDSNKTYDDEEEEDDDDDDDDDDDRLQSRDLNEEEYEDDDDEDDEELDDDSQIQRRSYHQRRFVVFLFFVFIDVT